MSSMTSMPGVFTTTHKDGSTYYRVSITYKNKHISLGSYDDIKLAARAYRDADILLHDDDGTPLSDMAAGHLLPDLHYPADTPLSFENGSSSSITGIMECILRHRYIFSRNFSCTFSHLSVCCVLMLMICFIIQLTK